MSDALPKRLFTKFRLCHRCDLDVGLGIDVGDLDRVIQIDSPFTVASFLQRIGRTGRRAGSSRNCLFLATKEDAFLRALALVGLWRKGFVEPIKPPLRPDAYLCPTDYGSGSAGTRHGLARD